MLVPSVCATVWEFEVSSRSVACDGGWGVGFGSFCSSLEGEEGFEH